MYVQNALSVLLCVVNLVLYEKMQEQEFLQLQIFLFSSGLVYRKRGYVQNLDIQSF